jgi:hypothetical protein
MDICSDRKAARALTNGRQQVLDEPELVQEKEAPQEAEESV